MTVIDIDFSKLGKASQRQWSAQQNAIFEWFEATYPAAATLGTEGPRVEGLRDSGAVGGLGGGHLNLVVRARAGTGKTTTILEGIDRAPDGSILLCAFNKRIADELQGRLANPHATAKTLHSLGFAAVRSAWNVRVCEGSKRAWNLAKSVCYSGSVVPDEAVALVVKLHTKGRELLPYAKTGAELVGLAVEFDCAPTEEFLSVPGFAGFDLDWVCDRAAEAMELAATVKPAEGIDFADMIFLPLRNRWLRPQYDLVVVDECQDQSMPQLAMAMAVLKPGGRMAVVGDDRQAIYGFRGADSGSIDRLKAELKAMELPLTVTYRCGLAIVKEAQRLVPDFEAAESVSEGSVRTIEGMGALIREASALSGDFVLSRKNAPLAKVAMAFIRAQKRVRIEGKDVGAGLKAQVIKLAKGMGGNGRSSGGVSVGGGSGVETLLDKLQTWQDREVAKYTAMGTDVGLTKADDVIDKANTIRVLCEDVVSVEELLARIDGLFSDYGKGMVVCSSIHKAKGLEAGRVYVLRDTLGMGKAKDQREEKNLEYVSITRAQEELVWVEGVK